MRIALRPLSVALALTLSLAALTLAACAEEEPAASGSQAGATTTPSAEPTAAAADVELSQLLANPTAYDDQRVRVRGVADNFGPAMFSLVPAAGAGTQTDDPSAGVRGLFVVHLLGQGPQDGDAVTVTGEVNDIVDIAAIEDALGIDLDDQLVRTLRLGGGDVILIADDVATGS
jgi:hypothetical protein